MTEDTQNSIGTAIGIIETPEFSTRGEGKIDVRTKIKIDFTKTPDSDIIAMLIADRKIAFQGPRRDKKVSMIKGCDGKTFLAHKIKELPELTQAEKNVMSAETLLKQSLITQDMFDHIVANNNN